MKKVVFLVFVSVVFFVNNFAQNIENDTITAANNYSTLSDSIIAFGKKYMNVRYRSGGMSAIGFDCSGFTSYIYKNFGRNIARTAAGQAQQLNKVKKGDWQRGDLVFFNGRKRGNRIGHVGMVVDVNSDGSFNFIHASVKGVRITNSEQNYYKLRYMGAGRVIEDANQVVKRETPIQNLEKEENPAPQISQNQTENSHTNAMQHFIYYTVKAAESIYAVARKFKITPQEIKDFNGLENEKIHAGQKLIVGILTDDTQEVTNVQSLDSNSKNNAEKLKHIVHHGDTLYSISRTYGCSIEQLRQWNNKHDNELKIGEEILILNNKN